MDGSKPLKASVNDESMPRIDQDEQEMRNAHCSALKF
jgi:hypothetical protein